MQNPAILLGMSTLSNLDTLFSSFPVDFTEAQKAQARTIFFKEFSILAHRFFGGKMQTLPKCTLEEFNWFNVWYTPGVSAISTSIRDDNDLSFTLSNRGNLVAVVSNSTRVLGDGDCTPPGGLGVMEGKALLMKYLGGVDAIALCVDSRVRKDEVERRHLPEGSQDPEKVIEFVKMLQPSVGAVNLEDISQPDCFKILDELRESCDIPVWHDDAQGTACITLAGLINALKLANKKLSEVRITLLGAGASNTTIARLILADGGDPAKMILCDSRGGLHIGRKDVEQDSKYYRKWELCKQTNPNKIQSVEEAIKGADVLIALSTPGPGTVKKEWVASMAPKAIVFACANPVPEIWPHEAKEAGAFIVATGRGDFPNQVNNSVCFPGILKGSLLVRSRKITDGMAIRCAHSIADYSEKKGIDSDHILVSMKDTEVFAVEAADVAMQAIKEGVARITMSWDEVYALAMNDIKDSRAQTECLANNGFVKDLPEELFRQALEKAIASVEAL